MKVEADAEKKIGGGGSRISAEVSELERRLRVEKDSYNLLKSESELAKAAASQEIERHARDCSILRENVARLEVDCGILRERESKDRERIKCLLEEIRNKEREFSETFVELKMDIRDVECGKMRALDEAREWKKKYEEKGINFIDLEEEDSKIYSWKIKCEELERNVATLVEEGHALREKEVRDQERMKGLLQASEAKEREILELERARKRAQDEVSIWMEKYVEAEACRTKLFEENICLREKEKASAENAEGKEFRELEAQILKHPEEKFNLVDKRKGVENAKGKEQSSENNMRMEGSSCEPAFEIYEELPKSTEVFMKKSSQEDLISTPELNLVILDSDCEGEQSASDSDVEEETIPLSQLSKKRRVEVFKGIKRDLGSVSLQPCVCTGTKETSAMVVDVRILSGASSNTREEIKVPRSKKKIKLSDLSSPSTARNPGSTSRNGVGARRVRTYRKRKLNNQTNPREYTGRIPSDEQIQCSQKRAETLRSNLRFCNPSFIKSMAWSHVSGGFWLNLPREFCQKNLPSHEQKMILEDENGLEHEVNYMGGSTALSGGWRGFALDHNLERGDTLIFELCKPTRFKVYIIKAILEESSKYFDDRIGCEHTDDADKWAFTDTIENQNIDLSDFSKKPLKSWTLKADEKRSSHK